LLRGASFLGVRLPSSRCQPAASLRRASQARRLAVLDVSHVLDGLLRHRPCGFISPHYHVQGSPFRGFPSRTAVTPRRRPVPSRRWRRLATHTSLRERHKPPPRPQGFPPCESPLLVRQ
jgi:hypothetical protein